MDHAVLHKITIPATGTRLEARLIITGAPDGAPVADIRAALDEASASAPWNDGGIPWGNHDIRHPGRTGAWPRGTQLTPEVPATTWDALQAQGATAIRRITIRVPARRYAQLTASAARLNQGIQTWTLDAITRHLTWTQLPAELRHAIDTNPDPARALEQALQNWADAQAQAEQAGQAAQHQAQQGQAGQGPDAGAGTGEQADTTPPRRRRTGTGTGAGTRRRRGASTR